MTGEADGGESLVTGAVRNRIEGLEGIDFGDPVPRALRGIAEPIPICMVQRREPR